MAEQVLCAIPVQKKRPFRTPLHLAFVLTERRTILVPLTKGMLVQASKEARDQAKAEGKGFFGRWGAQLSATMSYTERYMAMDPEAILRQHQGCRTLENADIVSAKLRRREDQESDSTSWELSLRTSGERLKLGLQGWNEEVGDVLRRAYGDRLRK
jgi:hypothetical protein